MASSQEVVQENECIATLDFLDPALAGYGQRINHEQIRMTNRPAFEVLEIKEGSEDLCRKITADLPEYFGIPEANEHYALGVLTRVNFAARLHGELIGLLSLEFPYPNNANIYWMGVMKRYHGQGVGKALIAAAEDFSKSRRASSITVETLAPLECDENYLKTYNFYQNCGLRPLFDLKPAGYEWIMVYMCKPCLPERKPCDQHIHIREIAKADIDALVDSFALHNWHKPKSVFEGYLQEQQAGSRQVWLAFFNDELAGYVTLNWRSCYEPFLRNNIPEIMDLNVLPPFRKQGIGSLLMDIAEESAKKKSHTVGIGVGLYDGYGEAQKLYVKRGYIPDGRGPTYRYTQLAYGKSVMVDDDLVMWFEKYFATS